MDNIKLIFTTCLKKPIASLSLVTHEDKIGLKDLAYEAARKKYGDKLPDKKHVNIDVNKVHINIYNYHMNVDDTILNICDRPLKKENIICVAPYLFNKYYFITTTYDKENNTIIARGSLDANRIISVWAAYNCNSCMCLHFFDFLKCKFKQFRLKIFNYFVN